MCPACRNGMTNTTKMGCLRACGHVLCMTCINTLVAKDGACVDCGAECRQKDVIPLAMGGEFDFRGLHACCALTRHRLPRVSWLGTGFAATGAIIAKAALTPSFQG